MALLILLIGPIPLSISHCLKGILHRFTVLAYRPITEPILTVANAHRILLKWGKPCRTVVYFSFVFRKTHWPWSEHVQITQFSIISKLQTSVFRLWDPHIPAIPPSFLPPSLNFPECSWLWDTCRPDCKSSVSENKHPTTNLFSTVRQINRCL